VKRWGLTTATLALLLGPAPAFAQRPAKHKPAAHAAAARKTTAPASSGTSATAKERTPSAGGGSGSNGSSGMSAESSGGGDEGGGDDAPEKTAPSPTAGKNVKSKTYTFGAMDVEGKLKTPQLLYFLNRVKLELDMSAPDKRSFMKELQQSADDKNL